MVLFPSFFDGLARSVSFKKLKSIGRNDSGREAAKAMAKDAKRNALLLSSPGIVSSDKSSKFVSVCSKRGQKGTNQDCTVVWQEYGCQEDMIFCGIFDGHGPWGHVVAKRVRESVPSSLLCNWQEALSLSPNGNDRHFDTWKQCCVKTYEAIDQELKLHPAVDCFQSGTTALTIVMQGENLIIANAGDSRAVLATSDVCGGLVPVQLTVDFKPNLPQEAERIMLSQGQIFCLKDEPGVYRVWMPCSESPGLAVSRALGDYCLKDFGLTSVPDVTHRVVTERDQFAILATDGVWDVISNQEAVDIVASAPDRGKSAKRLVENAVRAWKEKRKGIAMDDISAICLFFHSASYETFMASEIGSRKKAC